MQMWIKVEAGYITDCIQYEYEGYLPVEFEVPLPDHFIAGCYKYDGNNHYSHDEIKHTTLFEEEPYV